MRNIEQGIKDYVAMKKAMGFSFARQEGELRQFCRFINEKKKKHITCELAKEWALAGKRKPDWWSACKLSVLRYFAVYWKTIEPKTELWTENLWPIRYKRKNPYIYSDEEIQRIMKTCRELRPHDSLRPLTFATLFGFIATCGLRLSEALTIKKSDVDLKNGVVAVRRAKFYKPRMVPLHKTTLKMLTEYSIARENFCTKYLPPHHQRSDLFFISNDDAPITTGVAEWTFDKIALKCGVRKEPRRGPRLHDLRHTFIVRSLEDWYRQGKDVEVLLPILATYVGHTQPGSTYWYITITPELMGLASERLDQYMGGLSQ